MTLSEKRRHFSLMFAELVVWCHSEGIDVAIDRVHSTEAEQAYFVEIGASQTMNSSHLDGLAGDLLVYEGTDYITDPEAYRRIGEQWTSLDADNIWGGSWTSFPDFGHVEYAG